MQEGGGVREAAGAPLPLPAARPGAGARRRGLPGNGRSPPATCAGRGGRGRWALRHPCRSGRLPRDPRAAAGPCPPLSRKLRQKRGGRREAVPAAEFARAPAAGPLSAAEPALGPGAAGSWGRRPFRCSAWGLG